MDAISSSCHSHVRAKPEQVPAIDRGHRSAIDLGRRAETRAAYCARPTAEPEAVERGDELVESTALSYKRTEKTSLVIRTQEGDIVKLSFKARDVATGTVATASDGETELTEISLAAKSSTRLAVFVKGDLNADELAAIQSVVDQAGELAREFFSGDAEAAFAQAAALEIDGAQLAKVALRMRVREEFAYSRSASALALPSIVLPAAAASPASVAAPADSGETAALPSPAVAGSTGEGGSAQAAGVETVAAAADVPVTSASGPEIEPGSEGPADAPAAAGSQVFDPFEFLSSVLSFLSRLIETFESGLPAANDGDAAAAAVAEGDDSAEASEGADIAEGEEAPGAAGSPEAAVASQSGSTGPVSFSLRLRIFSSVVANLTIAESAQPAAETLTEAVDTIAAADDPPYDAVA